MKDLDVRLQSEIVAAVKRAIHTVGMEVFKRASLFGSNDAQDVGIQPKKAA